MTEQIPPAIRIENQQLQLLDQRRLPAATHYLRIDSIDAAVAAIQSLAVRGAPAIGIAAAYALAQSMRSMRSAMEQHVEQEDSARVASATPDVFLQKLTENGRQLTAARPTAVNLGWAVRRLIARGETDPHFQALWDEAVLIHQEDARNCYQIGEAGLPLLDNAANILTHCNAGAMAVSQWGTATAPLYLAAARGKRLHVFVDETRPLLQGARITAWELAAAGIPHTLICDNAAASVMAAGKVDCVLVGTDRITRNGDVVNKIGTLNLAVLCQHFHIPFYVACPLSTFDAQTASGSDVIIEQRSAREVLGDLSTETPVHNPAFDITPAELVTAIITEKGVVRPPLGQGLLRFIEKRP